MAVRAVAVAVPVAATSAATPLGPLGLGCLPPLLSPSLLNLRNVFFLKIFIVDFKYFCLLSKLCQLLDCAAVCVCVCDISALELYNMLFDWYGNLSFVFIG